MVCSVVWNVLTHVHSLRFTVLICTMTFTRTLKSTGSISRRNDVQPIWESAQVLLQSSCMHRASSRIMWCSWVHTTLNMRPPSYRPIPTSVTPEPVRSTRAGNFKQHYHQHETLFNECVMNGTLVWQRDQRVYPYIPVSFINTQNSFHSRKLRQRS